MSFSGSLSFLLPFHCLPPAHQPAQLQPVIWSHWLFERVHTCTEPSSPFQRKVRNVIYTFEAVPLCRSQTHGQQQEHSLCNYIQCNELPRRFISQTFYMIGEVRVSGGNLILPRRSPEKEVWLAVQDCKGARRAVCKLKVIFRPGQRCCRIRIYS